MSLGIDLLELSTAQICLLGIYIFLIAIGLCNVLVVLYKGRVFHFLFKLIRYVLWLILVGIEYLVNTIMNKAHVKVRGKLKWQEVR